MFDAFDCIAVVDNLPIQIESIATFGNPSLKVDRAPFAETLVLFAHHRFEESLKRFSDLDIPVCQLSSPFLVLFAEKSPFALWAWFTTHRLTSRTHPLLSPTSTQMSTHDVENARRIETRVHGGRRGNVKESEEMGGYISPNTRARAGFARARPGGRGSQT